jgi:hypothetical protein
MYGGVDFSGNALNDAWTYDTGCDDMLFEDASLSVFSIHDCAIFLYEN